MDLGAVAGREAKTQGISLLVYGLSGNYPEIDRQSGYTNIVLSPEQIQHGQKFFLDMLESEPGEVRIQGTGDVFLPVLYKKYWPWIAGAVIAGALIGVTLKR